MDGLAQYKQQGRYDANRLYPIAEGCLCEDCEEAPARDHHHLDGDTHNNKRENVKLLCHRCHMRRERKDNKVGNRSRLTRAQIKRIRSGKEPMSKIAAELGMDRTYLQRVRTGKKNPKPSDAYVDQAIPDGYVLKDRRGKPRGLSVEQVKHICSFSPTLGVERAIGLAKEYGVNVSTVWKARGRQGCYADRAYGK